MTNSFNAFDAFDSRFDPEVMIKELSARIGTCILTGNVAFQNEFIISYVL